MWDLKKIAGKMKNIAQNVAKDLVDIEEIPEQIV